MVPKWALEAEASNEVGEPGGAAVAVNEAVGAWSGVMATPSGELPDRDGYAGGVGGDVMGVTLSELALAT